MIWDQEVAGSSPVTPILKKAEISRLFCLFTLDGFDFYMYNICIKIFNEQVVNRMFQVGDRVVVVQGGKLGRTVGTVTRITGKRKDVVVSFGDYEEIYLQNGSFKTSDVWSVRRIELLTPELEQKVYEERTIARCKQLFQKATLTVQQAEKILDILEV